MDLDTKGVKKKKRSPFLRGCLILALSFVVFFAAISLIGRSGGGLGKFSESIGIVDVKGVIANPYPINELIRKYGKEDRVKAIVLRINSPGGGVGPSQEIYTEVKKLKNKKIVVASIGALGASGGYYIACGADKIVANPGSITGSIGVIVEFVNMKELVEKIGIKGMVVKSGKLKDTGNPFRDMTAREKEVLKNLVDNIHVQFVEAVADGRKLAKSKVEKIADGRVFSGQQAKALGLIDFLGDFYDAVDIAANMAGISGEPRLLFPPKEKLSIIDLIKGNLKSIIGEIITENLFPRYVTK